MINYLQNSVFVSGGTIYYVIVKLIINYLQKFVFGGKTVVFVSVAGDICHVVAKLLQKSIFGGKTSFIVQKSFWSFKLNQNFAFHYKTGKVVKEKYILWIYY